MKRSGVVVGIERKGRLARIIHLFPGFGVGPVPLAFVGHGFRINAHCLSSIGLKDNSVVHVKRVTFASRAHCM
jgi:hypothetical protein